MDIRFCGAVYVCSYKDMFNSLVAKKEGTVKIVDGSAYEAINTETVNVTCRDETVHDSGGGLVCPEGMV